MPEQGLMVGAAVAVAALFFLIQLFLATRPARGWGLIMPLIFLGFFVYAALDAEFLPLDIMPNQVGLSFFSTVGLLGLVISLAEYIWCRRLRRQRELRREQEREARRLAHRQRREAAAYLRDEDMSVARAAVEAEEERMEKARLLELEESREKEQRSAKKELPARLAQAAESLRQAGEAGRQWLSRLRRAENKDNGDGHEPSPADKGE